jgi:hypothetical protein
LWQSTDVSGIDLPKAGSNESCPTNESCPRGVPAVGDEAAKPVAEEIDRQVGCEGPGEEDVAHLPRVYCKKTLLESES